MNVKRSFVIPFYKCLLGLAKPKPCASVNTYRLLTSIIAATVYADDAYEIGYNYGSEGTLRGYGDLILEAARSIAIEGGDALTLVGLLTYTAAYGFVKARGREGLEHVLDGARRIVSATSYSDTVKLLEALEVLGHSEILYLLEERGITKHRIEMEYMSVEDLLREASDTELAFASPHTLSRIISLARECVEKYRVREPVCIWHYVLHANVEAELKEKVWDAFRILVAHNCNVKRALTYISEELRECQRLNKNYTSLAKAFLVALYVIELF